MRLTNVLVCVWIVTAGAALAAPDTSLRPVARADNTAEPATTSLRDMRPVARPALLEAALVRQLTRQFETGADPGFQRALESQTTLMSRAFAAVSPQATGWSLRPILRPDSMIQKAMAQRRERAKGAVCGDPGLQGEFVGFVPGRIAACGIEEAVKIRSVSGIALSQQALMDCTTAAAFKKWVDRGVKPAIGNAGGGVSQIRVAAHYACRTRNNQPGAKISEHGKGRAIDISGFRLRDGTEITLLQDWNRRGTGTMLRQMHQRACGIFGTVLGPDSDRFHKDHFHFDTARHRGGAFCR